MQNEIQKEHVIYKKGNAATAERNAKREHRAENQPKMQARIFKREHRAACA